MPLTTEQNTEMETARSNARSTLRPTSQALEDILFRPFDVHDHGFVRVIDYMGDDAAIVQAARVSYGRGTRRVSEDRALIRYLMRHSHSTPFEMATIKLHVKMPIFVARQWIRHRTASVNEVSARYSVLDSEFYIPDRANLAAQSRTNRQGRDALLEGAEADEVLRMLREDALRNYDHYAWMLNEGGEGPRDAGRQGLTRELARMNLTLNSYTQWYWKTDLHNLLNFLRLRADAHAQFEIRAYAEIILDIVGRWVPLTFEAFRDYRMESLSLSRQGVDVVRRILAGETVGLEGSGMPEQEWRELMAALRPNAT